MQAKSIIWERDGTPTSSQIQAKSGCNKPCSYITLGTNTAWEREKRYKTKVKLLIFFKENIKVTKAYHIYSGLSLVAEIRGYVGLFLGETKLLTCLMFLFKT